MRKVELLPTRDCEAGWLRPWPQMTFDLGILPLTTWTYKGSHIISINQVWFESDFNFSNEATFTFSAYLITWPQMTFDLDMWPWPHQQNPSKHVEVQQQHGTKWSLCVFPAKAGDTKKIGKKREKIRKVLSLCPSRKIGLAMLLSQTIRFKIQWQLVNTKFMGIGILVLVIRTSCYPSKLWC